MASTTKHNADVAPNIALFGVGLLAVLVHGCGPVNVQQVASDARDAATPYLAFVGRWMPDEDSFVLVTKSQMIDRGFDEQGFGCMSVFDYEVIEEKLDPFAVTVRMTKPSRPHLETILTYEFSEDRRQMRRKDRNGYGQWLQYIEPDADVPDFRELEE